MTTVVVTFGGPERPSGVVVPKGATVVAANGGVDLARELGFQVDLAVGDFDSVSESALTHCSRIERHSASKDASDLELALDAAMRMDPARVLVVGGAGGRLDHLFGVLLLLAAEKYAALEIAAQVGGAAVHVIRGERRLTGEPEELVSLFAVHGPACGIVTDGLLYPLRGETLDPGSSRGLSNVFAASEARVALDRGVLLAVRPSGSVSAEGWG